MVPTDWTYNKSIDMTYKGIAYVSDFETTVRIGKEVIEVGRQLFPVFDWFIHVNLYHFISISDCLCLNSIFDQWSLVRDFTLSLLGFSEPLETW